MTTETKSKASPDKRELNAARHGLAIKRLSLGNLPAKWSNVVRQVQAFRMMLETAVIELRGSVSLADACQIQSCCKWERHGMLAQKWLRDNPDLPATERLEFSKEIVRASEARDRYVKGLGLAEPAKPDDPWAFLTEPITPAAGTAATATPAPGTESVPAGGASLDPCGVLIAPAPPSSTQPPAYGPAVIPTPPDASEAKCGVPVEGGSDA